MEQKTMFMIIGAIVIGLLGLYFFDTFGAILGAVTGAIMVLGLKFAGQQPETPEGRKTVKEAVIKFTELFKSLNGSTECKDLLSVDISTPLGQQKAKDKNLFRTVCPKFIKDSASILEQIINESKSVSQANESDPD